MIGLNDWFNSVSARIPLAVLGGVLYGLLTYEILLLGGLSFFLVMTGAVFVFVFYLGSRLLILFSGFDSRYYWKERSGRSAKDDPFYRTAQWVGTFYHYHDIALFAFLMLICTAFLITLVIDWTEVKPLGESIQNFRDLLGRRGV